MSVPNGRERPGLLERIALIGTTPADTDAIRAQKGALTIAVLASATLAVAWVGTYLALGLPVSAAIPFGYQVVSVIGLVLWARTKAYEPFRLSQLVLMLVLPFLLQWSLGGYAASSVVSLWALIAALGALFFYTPRDAIPWFIAFLLLTVVSGVLDPLLARHPAAIPDAVRTTFFVLNVVGASLTAYLLLRYSVRARDAAQERSDQLLLNVLPRAIAERLKRQPGVIAEHHDEVTVLFADVAGFTPFVQRTPATRVVAVLNEVFSAFDELAERHGLEKIKTIGDAYMAVAGLPEARADHARAAAEMALEMQAEAKRLAGALGLDLAFRIGIDSGAVVAGVIGRRKFSYDLWGDTVNTASRMQSHGLPGRIQVTQASYERLRDAYRFEDRGEIEVKGKGRLHAYLLLGPLSPAV
jgi:adenylate cyclase